MEFQERYCDFSSKNLESIAVIRARAPPTDLIIRRDEWLQAILYLATPARRRRVSWNFFLAKARLDAFCEMQN